MINNKESEIIAAVITGNVSGAVATIRVSGSKTWQAVQPFFSKNFQESDSHQSHLGQWLGKDGSWIDQVLLTVFRENRSYTGEESVEISCHASHFIVSSILQCLGEQVGRLAAPGEFTQRAFLNGKLDLSQAEAVADLIAAESKHAHDIAGKQLKGHFSNELKTMREELIHFASMLELELDFSEEDVEFADRSALLELIDKLDHKCASLIESFSLGQAIKNGVPVAIVGEPNVGKSTLLNQFLQEDRAIVSDIAGTTRDVIEELLNIDGYIFRLVDTAGIRDHTEDSIEKLGIEKSHQKIAQAQLVLLIADAGASDESVQRTKAWLEKWQLEFPEKHFLVVLNKADKDVGSSNWSKLTGDQLSISAKNGEGLDHLKEWMVQAIFGKHTENQTIITNSRHLVSLKRTKEMLDRSREGLKGGTTADWIAMDIRQALHHLGSITGQITEEDLLSNIFSKFCIGK